MFRCSVKTTFLNVGDIAYGMLSMTKIVLKIICKDSNPPVLAENLLTVFGVISGLLFSLNILLVLKLFLAKGG